MTDIPKTPMKPERANYTVERMLTHLGYWQYYATEPVADLNHARDKLAALAKVMNSMCVEVIDRWNYMMIHGIPEEHMDDYDGGLTLDPRMAEDRLRGTRERGGDSRRAKPDRAG